jgi:hypothetical protein
VDHAAARLRELKAERAALSSRLTQATPNVEELRQPLEAAVRDLLTVFASRTGQARDVLRKALAGDRLKVRPDPERGYVVEGMLRVTVSAARSARPGPTDREVAGACFSRENAGPMPPGVALGVAV